MTIKTIEDVDLAEKRVLIRVDFNLPIKDGQVTSDARIHAALPTINNALQQGAKVMLLTHLGRPKEGIFDPEASVRPVCDRLETIIGHTVRLVSEPFEGVSFESNEIIMFENVRFLKGEKKDDPDLAKTYADLCDVFIMDAFATAHRAQASTHGVAKRAKEACAGKLVAQEVNALTKALHEPERPVVAIVGGSKVSTKLTVLKNLIPKVDVLIPGGGIANTFLKASGYDIGSSMVDNDLLKDTENLLKETLAFGCQLPLPVDVRVSETFSEHASATIRPVSAIQPEEMILDIGPESERNLNQHLQNAATIVWNGPVGVFEFDHFASGTRHLAHDVAKSEAFSIAGGGDTIAAIEHFKVENDISYISTAGGAFLEFLEGKTLPGIEVLKR